MTHQCLSISSMGSLCWGSSRIADCTPAHWMSKIHQKMDQGVLRAYREHCNHVVFKVAQIEMPYVADLTAQAVDEVESGAMTKLAPVDFADVSSKSYSRRTPVRELRKDGGLDQLTT